jgi:hypothetical protein
VIFVLATFIEILLISAVILQQKNDLLGGINEFSSSSPVYAHFFGDNKTIDGFRVVFLPFPPVPVAGENTTLNFSVLDEENSNINNIFSALIIKEKESNQVVGQTPYKRYEFSDFSIPYKFSNNTKYEVTLETRVMGDPKYQAKPIVASFDLSVGDLSFIAYRNLMIYYVTPVSLVAAGCLVIIYRRIKRKKEYEDEDENDYDDNDRN